jgi:hypothetical protein
MKLNAAHHSPKEPQPMPTASAIIISEAAAFAICEGGYTGPLHSIPQSATRRRPDGTHPRWFMLPVSPYDFYMLQQHMRPGESCDACIRRLLNAKPPRFRRPIVYLKPALKPVRQSSFSDFVSALNAN